MITSIILIIIGSCLLGISKAVADITQHIDIWSQSIFSTVLETSFLGPKDKTWIRKDHSNKLLNWLLHYPFVWVTDIWHFANMINSLSFIPLLVGMYLSILHPILTILIFYVVRNIIFNLFYHLILKKNEKK